MKKTRIKSLLTIFIIIIVSLSFSSCQNSLEAYSLSGDKRFLSLEDFVYSLKSTMDSISNKLLEMSVKINSNNLKLNSVSKQVNKNYEMIQTMYASVTYMDLMKNPPDLSNNSKVPTLEEVELLISSRIKEKLENQSSDNSQLNTGIQNDDKTAEENQYLKSKVEVLQAEIETLKKNYASLKWQTYVDSELLSDPFSLEESSLITGGMLEYKIQSGDTLSEISRAFYGSANMVEKIMEYNGITDPRSISRGDILRLDLENFRNRIKIPVYGIYVFTPDLIETFYGESIKGGFSRGLTLNLSNSDSTESEIIPILPGKVIDTGSGYAVVYHGNNLKSVYSLMDSVNVQKGQFVSFNDTLGKCSGGKLTLELILNSEYRDPLMLFLNKIGDFSITFYTEWDDGNLPYFPYFRRTKAGTFAREWYTVAADEKIFPPGSVIYIPELKQTPSKGVFLVEDTGSAIKGNKIDVYIRDLVEASKLKTLAAVYRL